MARFAFIRSMAASAAVALATAAPAGETPITRSPATTPCVTDLARAAISVGDLAKDAEQAAVDCKVPGSKSDCSADVQLIVAGVSDTMYNLTAAAEQCTTSVPVACAAGVERAATALGQCQGFTGRLVIDCPEDPARCAEDAVGLAAQVALLGVAVTDAVTECQATLPQMQPPAQQENPTECLVDVFQMTDGAHKLVALGRHVVADCERNATACTADVDAAFAGLDELDKAAVSAAQDCMEAGGDCSAGIQQFAGAVDECKGSVQKAAQDCPTDMEECAKDALAVGTCLGRVARTLESAAKACALGERTVEMAAVVV